MSSKPSPPPVYQSIPTLTPAVNGVNGVNGGKHQAVNGANGSAASAIPHHNHSPSPPAPSTFSRVFDSIFGHHGAEQKEHNVTSSVPPPAVPKRQIINNQIFYYKLDKITGTFDHSNLTELFLEFEIGGQFEVELADSGEEQMIKKKVKGADGKETEEEVSQRVMIKRIKILKPKASTYFTRFKPKVKTKTEISWHDHVHEGIWEGLYSDLLKEFLTIRVWLRRPLAGPNTLVATGREPLSHIVASKIDREIRLFKYVEGGLSARRELFGSMRYKFEFQEFYNYHINVSEWQMRRLEAPRIDNTRRKWLKCIPVHWLPCISVSKVRYVSFEVLRSREGAFSYLFRSLQQCLNIGETGKVTIQLADGIQQKGGTIAYPGTRAWLEDESLVVAISKRILGCFRIEIGRRSEELQGLLDYGSLRTEVNVEENVNVMACCTGGQVESAFVLQGTVDANGKDGDQPLPLYRQMGNADPSIDRFALVQPEGATFLVVKILKAKGLSSTEASVHKDQVNASVTVQWQNIKKSTRTIKDSVNPVWDDEVHFKLMDRHMRGHKPPKRYEDFSEKIREGRVTVMVWDNEGFSRIPLGYCHVDFHEVYFERTRTKIISFSSNGRKVDRLVFKSGEKKLFAPFATDGQERRRMKKHEERDEFATRFIEFMIYFDRMDSNPIPLQNKKQRDRDALQKQQFDELHIASPLSKQSIISGRAHWDGALKDIIEREERFFPFYGMDEFSGTLHFLPTFLKRMSPPTDVASLPSVLHFVHCLQCIRKPLPYVDPAKDDTAKSRGDVWSWCDPYFLLEKRKGGINDHALLLCNFLLGMHMDAYVCVGTVRTPKQPELHCWVMTLEKAPVEEGEEAMLNVRFWETTTGSTFLLKDRFHWEPYDVRTKEYELQPDPVLPPSNLQLENELMERKMEDERNAKFGIKKSEEQMAKEQAAWNSAKEEREREIERLNTVSRAELDLQRKAKEGDKGAQAEILSREFGELEAHEEAQAQHADDDKRLLELTSARGSGPAVPPGGVGAGASTARGAGSSTARGTSSAVILHLPTRVQEVKADSESVRSIFDEQKQAQVADVRIAKKHRESIQADLAVQRFMNEQKQAAKRQTPYLSLNVVFNNQHLYANKQSPDPELIKYDLRTEQRWFEFKDDKMRDFLKILDLKEFYCDKGVASMKAAQKEVEDLQSNLLEVLKSGLSTYREFAYSFRTEFLERFEFQIDENNETANNTAQAWVQKRLQHEEHCAMHKPDLVFLHNYLNPKDLIDVNADEQEWVDKVWRPEVLKHLPSNVVYMEETLFFKHSIRSEIATAVQHQCQYMYDIPDARRPKFVLGVLIPRLPACICPARIFVGCMANDK